jgi:hypothetical protein
MSGATNLLSLNVFMEWTGTNLPLPLTVFGDGCKCVCLFVEPFIHLGLLYITIPVAKIV